MEFLHEVVTNLTEERHLSPAAAKSAGTRKAMTFTLHAHLYLYGLPSRFIVMQVNKSPDITSAFSLHGIHEQMRLFIAKVHIISTALPFPVSI